MTREEAIKELQESHDTLRDYDIDNSSRLKQALLMAISALEQTDIEQKSREYEKAFMDGFESCSDLFTRNKEQEPCDDAISRQAVEEITWEEPSYTDALNVLAEIRDKVKALPSVTQKSGWIPVSERVPQDHDWYLIVVKEKSTGYQYIPRVATYLHDNDWVIIDTEDANKEWLDDLECIAWMPLPKPYEPQESEE